MCPAPGMLSLRDYEAAAQPALAPAIWDYYAGGAADEVTLRDNEAAYGRRTLLPRMLRGAGKVDLATTLLASTSSTGQSVSAPILLSPTAFHRLAHEQGERATARAAARAGVIMVVSQAATVAIGDLVEAGALLWFQLYIQPEFEVTAALVARAEAAGVRALVVTVDSPVFGAHERDVRNGFDDLPPGYACENMRNLPGAPPGELRPIAMSPDIGWGHIAELRRMTSLPIVLKGIAHPDDVRLAVHHGIDGVLLSNHGGRQLDTVPATIDLLADAVAAAGGRIPVLIDGGVRRGTDVVAALALGAAAVGIGRPVLWGLAVDGQAGVEHVIELLRAEVERAFTLCGAASVTDLHPDLVGIRR